MKRGRILLWQDWRFRLIWIGQTASIFGDRITGIALPWLLLLQTHSAVHFAHMLLRGCRIDCRG